MTALSDGQRTNINNGNSDHIDNNSNNNDALDPAIEFLDYLPPNIKYTSIPSFVVNLDDKPEDRWTHIIIQYKQQFHDVLQVMNKFLNELLPHPFILTVIKFMCHILVYLNIMPHSKEFIAMARATNLRPRDLSLLHFAYEVTSFCTCFLINDRRILNSSIHLRTMDWSMPFDLRALTANIHFVNKRKQHLFSGVVFVGSVGILTGFKPNAFSIAVNFRNSSYSVSDSKIKPGKMTTIFQTITGLLKNLWMVFYRGWTVSAFIRYVLTNADTYSKAVHLCQTQKLISPTYITIVGNGVNQGTIITRDRLADTNMAQLKNVHSDSHLLIPSQTQTHTQTHDNEHTDTDTNTNINESGSAAVAANCLIQCNSDHWAVGKLTPLNDIYESKERFEIGIHYLPFVFEEDGDAHPTTTNKQEKRSGRNGKSMRQSERNNKQKSSQHCVHGRNLVNIDGFGKENHESALSAMNERQLRFIEKCWQLLSVYPILNEETVYASIMIPGLNLMLNGNTTTAFQAVNANEFKQMFYQ